MKSALSPLRRCAAALSALLLLGGAALPSARADSGTDDTGRIELTAEEEQYIADHPVVRVAMGPGIAPLEYFGADGRPAGIAVEVTGMVAQRTGLTFEYLSSDSWKDVVLKAKSGQIDLIDGMPDAYRAEWFPGYPVSRVYLRSTTLLYVNKSVGAEPLAGKTYAAAANAALPDGVDPAHVKYYDTQEACIDAVEAGDADYGCGDEFSVTYYVAQNYLSNVLTVPSEQETREGRMIYICADPLFQSIMDKALNSLDDSSLQSAVLLGMTHVSGRITLRNLLREYGAAVFAGAAAFFLILLACLVLLLRSSRRVRKLSRHFFSLSGVSAEALYKYDAGRRQLQLLDRCAELLGSVRETESCRDELAGKVVSLKRTALPGELTAALTDPGFRGELTLHAMDGGARSFRVVKSVIAEKGRPARYILGKLMSVSQEKEQEEKAGTDAATRLLNEECCKERVRAAIARCTEASRGALLILDIDDFQAVNDTFGPAVGDAVILALADAMRMSFRQKDVLGRVGGDEFCVFLCDGISEPILCRRFEALSKNFRKCCAALPVQPTISIGSTLVSGGETLEAVYQMADASLYAAKNTGKNACQIGGDPSA